MPLFDVILLLIWAGFVFYGLFFGLIRIFGVFAGIFIGAFVASHYYLVFYPLISFIPSESLGKIVAFVLLFGIANKLTSFGFALLDKAFNIVSIIPFLKTFNRLLGASFGFLSGGMIMGLFFYFASRQVLVGTFFADMITDSQIASLSISFVYFLLPLIPAVLENLKSVMGKG